jgi:hypothetical protein
VRPIIRFASRAALAVQRSNIGVAAFEVWSAECLQVSKRKQEGANLYLVLLWAVCFAIFQRPLSVVGTLQTKPLLTLRLVDVVYRPP